MSTPRLRDYRPDDRAACVALFESNVPDYFATIERADFLATLDGIGDGIGGYWVLEQEDGSLVACGGYAGEAGDRAVAVLCWGMVRRDLHRRGLGRILLRERLRRIDADPGFTSVLIETTPFSRDFYARHGFEVSRVQIDGFAPGYDLVEMRRARPVQGDQRAGLA